MLVFTNMIRLLLALVELFPILAGIAAPPALVLLIAFTCGPMHLLVWFLAWPVAAIGGVIAGLVLSNYVAERYGQPWALLSFCAMLASSLFAARLLYFVVAPPTI